MKLKKTLLLLLSTITLVGCNRTSESDISSGDDSPTSSTPVEKSNYLTQAMFDEIKTGFSIDETVTTKLELKASESWDAKNVISSMVQYVDCTDDVYHIIQGMTITDTKVDPVSPDRPELIDQESYYVPQEKEGKKYVYATALNLNNEQEFSPIYIPDDDGNVTVDSDIMTWDDNFAPFFSMMEVDDFEKEPEEKRTFTFSIDETDNDPELLKKAEAISLQLIGVPSIKLKNLSIHTDGYHITEFSADFYPYDFTYEGMMNLGLTYSIEGSFTVRGEDKVEKFGPATGDDIAGFSDRLAAFRNHNFAVLEQEYASDNNDGSYKSKPNTSVSASTNGKAIYYWSTPSNDSEKYLREASFQIDDSHYVKALELYDDETQTNKTWYYESPAVKGSITNSLPTFEISSKLFEPVEYEDFTYRLKDKYLKSVYFQSSTFDMFVNVGSTITYNNVSYPLTDFVIDLHEQDKVVFTYYYDFAKYVVTYYDAGKQEELTSIPTIKYLTLGSSLNTETLKADDSGKKKLDAIKTDWGVTDDGLVDEVFKHLPLIPGNSGFVNGTIPMAENDTRSVFGYMVQLGNTEESTVNNVAAAYVPFCNFFLGLGYTALKTKKYEGVASLEQDFTKTITYNNEQYNLNVNVIVLYLPDYQAFLVGYCLKVEKVTSSN